MKNAVPALNIVKTAVGENCETYRKAEKTKRRLMILPLLPDVYITQEVIALIKDDWKDAVPEGLEDVVDDLAAMVLRTYVGTGPTSNGPPRAPPFPPSLWSVSGRSVRTNNGAESLHSEINGTNGH